MLSLPPSVRVFVAVEPRPVEHRLVQVKGDKVTPPSTVSLVSLTGWRIEGVPLSLVVQMLQGAG